MIFQIYGESNHDRSTIRNLTLAILNPEVPSCELLRRPLILRRNSEPGKKIGMNETIAAFYAARSNNGQRVIVIIHRDCDAVEPAHINEKHDIVQALNAAGVPIVIAAVPAWELETWLMLFPEAIRRTRGCWRQVNYGHSNVGMVVSSKERLSRDLRPVNAQARARCPDYSEADSVTISEEVQRDPALLREITSTSASFDLFQHDLTYAVANNRQP